MVLPDSKPVQDAINLIKKGKFSASSRMNRFLSNVNRIPITVKHLSGRYNLNEISDHQSRHPASCNAETCSIHKFISELSDSVMDPAAKCAAIDLPPTNLDTSLYNRAAWRSAQEKSNSCRAAKSHLTTGKTPTNKSGDMNNEIRFLIRTATVAPDGLLVTEGDSSTYIPGEPKEKIIVPHNIAAGTLYHLHNSKHFVTHPSQHQLKTAFNRRFYTWNLQPLLDDLYKNCYTCQIVQKQPFTRVPNQTKSNVSRPNTHFHSDVIKRAGQNILILIDHFTSMISSMLIPSEKEEDLKSGLITLTTPIRYPGPITIVTDWAPGFISAARNDKQLKDLHINIQLKDQLNRNFNAVVDRACQDLEAELRKLAPEGEKINQATLAKATIACNTILRRSGISAFEMHTARNQDTGANLSLDDSQLQADQIKSRKSSSEVISPDIRVGDTVAPISPQDKHKSREIYLVTDSSPQKVTAQRLIHPLTEAPTKIMSRVYESHPKHLRRLHRPPSPHPNTNTHREYKPLSSPRLSRPSRWSPVNPKYFEDDSTDDEDEDFTPDIEDIAQPAPAPDTPPSSMEPSVLQNLDPSSSDRSPPSSLPDMEPTSDQIAFLRTTTDDSVDTIIPDQDLDSPPFMEDLNQTVNSTDENNLRDSPVNDYQDALHVEPDHNAEATSSHPVQQAPGIEENITSPNPVQGAAALDPNLPDLNLVPEEAHQEDFSFLYNYDYDQHRKPKRNDIIVYFDGDSNDWAEVRVLSKTKQPNNYNIRFLNIQRRDENIYFNPGEFWSIGHPQPRDLEGAVPEDDDQDDFPPIQEERFGHDFLPSLQVSPALDLPTSSRMEPGQVYVLPQDTLRDHLSPKSRRRAATLSLHPGQEHMRSGIARSLATPMAPSKPHVAFFKSLEKAILGKR